MPRTPQQKKKLIFLLLATEPKVLTHLFESSEADDLRASSNDILLDSWELTSKQQTLLHIALEIWEAL